MSKYGNKKIKVDEFLFDSQAEAKFYEYLKKQKELGVVVDFEMQVVYEIQEGFRHPRSGKWIRAIKYIPDFVVHYVGGETEVVDIKGMKTDVYKMKAKMFMHKYKIPLIEIKYDRKQDIFIEI